MKRGTPMSNSESRKRHTAENDALPERIGYADPWPRTEYGVFEDRRSNGLGFALVEATENREHANRLVSKVGDYPRFQRVRVVVYQPWGRVIPPEVGAS